MKKPKSTEPLLRELVASPSFPRGMNDLEKCWNTQKRIFLTERKCDVKKKYHDNVSGCGAVDASIEKRFGSRYKKHLFQYYRVVGDLGSTRSMLRRLIKNEDIPSVESFLLARKTREKLQQEGISRPHEYEEKFPETLNPIQHFGTTKRLLEQGKLWIANCVTDRIEFRDSCVKDCNTRLIDREHQDFIIKLQVLYANTDMAYRRARN